ncbi:nitroreductase family protein [Corynebacterium sp. ES2794-CONJ1]|uniref:nitroreductase family protein n=1 Tax=unclassified Corynebacterium TaxID=2624378 RepID=UPI00216AE6E0|nr:MULTISPECIES: nitroreductase family protein [unclassified Corynebacterium]MCS4532333.1 nitroreductase family protein [Corynebacterium sp. ES2730-CONJ]MCU9519704.1 nitroreductase family protein [Corynebacterium sp. ES2794-CONJ1]
MPLHDMSVREAIESRRATRHYTDQPVTDEVLDHIVTLALEAPSAFNGQRRDLVVVRDQQIKDGIYKASQQTQLRDAPVVLVAIARTGEPDDLAEIVGEERAEGIKKWLMAEPGRLRESAIKDAMIMGSFAMIAAQSQGLVTSPTTGWDERGILEAVGLGDSADHGVGIVLAMGYPAESPEHPGRRDDRRVDNHY